MAGIVTELWPRGRAWLRAHPLVGDALLAAVLLAVQQSVWLVAPQDVWPSSWLVATGWAVGEMLAVVLRRRWP
ncbi:MAG: hypothetical protein FWJ93_14530, partial [Micromonosporaceae bacterium]